MGRATVARGFSRLHSASIVTEFPHGNIVSSRQQRRRRASRGFVIEEPSGGERGSRGSRGECAAWGAEVRAGEGWGRGQLAEAASRLPGVGGPCLRVWRGEKSSSQPMTQTRRVPCELRRGREGEKNFPDSLRSLGLGGRLLVGFVCVF